MSKTTFSLLGSLIYFGLAVFAIKQFHPDGQNGHFLAQLLAVCAAADVFGIALLAQPKQRGLITPVFLPCMAKTMRFLAGALTLPCIVFWGTGEVLLQPAGELKQWTKSVITFSNFKRQLEGDTSAREYLNRAAYASGRIGEAFERKDQLLEAYEYYSSYAELQHARWPNAKVPQPGGAAVLGRILDKMGRYREADQQYEIAERQLSVSNDQVSKLISDGRLMRLLKNVSKKSPLHSYVSNLVLHDEQTSALKMGRMFTRFDLRPIMIDWRESTDMCPGVAYSGEHMRDLLSKIKMRNVPESERAQMHTVDEFDFGEYAYPGTYLEPRSFRQYLKRCHVIMPVKTYARIKELSELD